MIKPVLQLHNLSKSFGSKNVLTNISLEIKQSEIIALIGKSGCGKSTLIKLIVGLHRPNSGAIFVGGKDSKKKQHLLKQEIGYTTQEGSYYEKLSVYENMRYYANLYNVPINGRERRIKELLESVDLLESHDSLVENISGGMKRRLDFALSLIHKPTIIILDEPTTGLDPSLIENFWRIVHKMVYEEKISVLVSTHHLSEVKNYCTGAIVMSKGKIVASKPINKDTNITKLFKEWTE
jgi:ABC-2 type transport system ATP-binding protein